MANIAELKGLTAAEKKQAWQKAEREVEKDRLADVVGIVGGLLGLYALFISFVNLYKPKSMYDLILPIVIFICVVFALKRNNSRTRKIQAVLRSQGYPKA